MQELIAHKVWELLLSPKNQRITQVIAKNPIERVHSQGRVLSDRSVLYKYINPNLVAVVTEGIGHAHKSKCISIVRCTIFNRFLFLKKKKDIFNIFFVLCRYA